MSVEKSPEKSKEHMAITSLAELVDYTGQIVEFDEFGKDVWTPAVVGNGTKDSKSVIIYIKKQQDERYAGGWRIDSLVFVTDHRLKGAELFDEKPTIRIRVPSDEDREKAEQLPTSYDFTPGRP